MKSILKIFLNDVKSLSKHFFAMAVIVAISVLPALYAWVNIYANSNPYVNTGNIHIAVASRDPGLDLEDGTHVNMADEVFDELRESDSIGWQFPDTPEDAIAGVESGEYYAAIIFEEKFTYNMYNFERALLDDNAPLTYYENAKKNPIASKITDTAATSLQESINTKYLETVFSIVFQETNNLSEELSSDGETTADSVIRQLQSFRDTLDAYDSAIGSFLSTSPSVKRSISDAQKNLDSSRASAKKDADNAAKNLAAAKKNVNTLRKTIDAKTSDIDERLDKLEKILRTIDGVNPVSADDLESSKKNIDEIRATLEQLKGMLDGNSSLSGAESLIVAIDTMLTELQAVETRLEEVPDQVQDLLAAIDTIRTLQNATLKPGFDALVDNLNKTVDLLGPFVASTTGMLDDINPVLDAAGSTIDSMDLSLSQLQSVLRSASDKIGSIIAQVEAAEEDDRVNLLIDLLGGDSSLYGKFFSSLVDVHTEEIYSVASYGAAMSPFYTVLAIWVGGVILVAILRTHVDREKFPGLNEAQYFFGRWILFFLLGQIQAAVTITGDIYLLDCQPVHPGLMYLAAAITSFVFILFIYALTLTFGDIGKAIVVIVMVVQIAGSSGSYPIEILPEIFSKIYRFFPFPYAINALREALCGMYGSDYYIYLAELMLFAVVALVIGILVRRHFIGINRFVSEKIEETEVL